MKKKHITARKIAFFIARLLLMLLFIVGITLILSNAIAETDENGDHVMYVICTPNDIVNVRCTPNTKQEPVGWLEAGDAVYPDGKKRNGFLHCVGLNVEAGEGWVHAGYLVEDKPELLNRHAVIVSKGRLAARKYVNGKRTRWLKPMASLTVFYWSDEWCLTNCGYVQSRYLELEE